MELNEWLDIWMTKYVKHTVKLRTYNIYGQLIEKHIKPKLGDYELDELTTEVLQDFVLEKLENGNLKNGKALSNNSVIVITNVLKQAISEANLFELPIKTTQKK